MYRLITQELKKKSKPEKVAILSRFFKCGKGEYGEGDKFLGVTVPDQRKVAKRYVMRAVLEDVRKLLESKWHEHRLTGLFLLVYKYEKAGEKERRQIYQFYLKNLHAVNNWDLVDTTTPNIVGEYMWEHPQERHRLQTLLRSKNVWRRRIAVLATFAFIKRDCFNPTLQVSRTLLQDSHDLIHKAVGWMLREIGKRDEKTLTNFLDTYACVMPRTMLRYSLERLNKKQKERYMKG